MSTSDNDSLDEAQWIDRVCDEFECSWLEGGQPEIEPHLADASEPRRTKLIMQLIAIDIEYRKRRGVFRSPEEYVARFSRLPLASVAALFDKTADLNTSVEKTSGSESARNGDTLDFSLERSRGDNFVKKIHYFGDYELLEKIARGGMGTVYRARQISLNRLVAVKMINSGQFASNEEVRRFYSEAEAAASLDHPNIVPVFEVGEFEGNHFFSMALVEGLSLAELLFQGPMKPVDAAILIRTVAHAVQFAHDQGVIHRDLKPSNILLERDGRPRVTDFGLAKRITDQTGITVSGDVLGTPSFMPPEQAAGKINAVGFRSDVYSLGAVLYTCLSARPPFQSASHIDTLRQVIDSEPVLLRQLNSAIPRDLETVTHKCLEKSVARRYDSPKSLADDLDRFLAGEPIAARPISSLERGIRWCKKNPARVLNIAGLFLILFGSTVGWLYLRFREREVVSQENAVSLIEQLNVASVAELPRIVQQVRAEPRTKKLLDVQYQSSPPNSTPRYRAGISLLPIDDSVVNDVCQAWKGVSWGEWIWIREQLSSRREAVATWVAGFDSKSLEDLDDGQYVRFVAIASYAASDVNEPRVLLTKMVPFIDSERILSTLLDELGRDPAQLSAAAQALFPLRDQLGTGLSKRMNFIGSDGISDASVAAGLTAELFQREPSKLIEYGWSARSELLPVLFGRLKDPKKMQQEMRRILESTSPAGTWDESNANDRRRAVGGTVLFGLGDYDSVWPLLCHRPNPATRSLMIEWIPIMEKNPSFVLSKLNSLLLGRPRHIDQIMSDKAKMEMTPNPWLFDEETSQLRCLLQMFGNYPLASVQRTVDEAFWTSVEERFEFDPDPGIHASCEWLLRRFGRTSLSQINDRLREKKVQRAGWYVNSNGHVMAIVHGPIQYTAGADSKDPDRRAGRNVDPVDGSIENWSEDDQHPKRIPRSLAVASKETSLSQINEFDEHFHVLQNKALGPTLEHPACRVSWHKAAEYCNWLSGQDHIPEDDWCFVRVEQTKEEMQLAPEYLHRSGYRLPTDAEWEYVCRAGTTTRRYFGDTDELLSQRTWYMLNSREKILSIPGRLKPNELGLFETLGNVAEWCLDEFSVKTPFMRRKENDIEGPLKSNFDRILRGGSIFSLSEDIRAADYASFAPSYREGNTGFRVVRTIESDR